MTTSERRLAKLEAVLDPTQLVLRWLDEAHAYDDFTAYTRSLFGAGPGAFPMDRLVREAEACAQIRTRGQPRAESEAAVRRSIIAALFGVQLILRINALSAECLEREGLVQAALGAHLGLALEHPASRDDGDRLGRLTQCRDLLLGRVNELHAFEAARTAVEARYLDGMAADVPAARRAWAEQRTRSETMAVIALRIAELDGADPPPADDHAAFDARVTMLTGDRVEPARSAVYGELGDGRRALAIALGWLEPKLG